MARGKKRGPIGRLIKWFANTTAAAVTVGVLASLYIRLFYYTTRWEWIGREHYEAANADPRSYIGAVWHARLLPIAMLRPRGRRAVALASEARDGEMIAQTMRFMLAETVRGSSRDPSKPDKERGGAAAVAPLVKALKEHAIVVITPDGPRGPLMRAKPGIARISATANAPVLPATYAARRAKLFKSWDRFMLPWPFNRAVFVFGPLIEPAASDHPEELEAKRREIEAAMIETIRRADAALGRATPEPGPAQQPETAQ